MKRIGLLGKVSLVALIALAVSAATAGIAAAALPELGRCVAVPRGTGEYSGASCVRLAGGKGTHNFIAGPGEKKKFVGTGGAVALESPNLKVDCAASQLEGEYTGPKTSSVTVLLIGCTDVATKQLCQSNPAKPGEIETPGPLEGELGLISVNGKRAIGLDLKRSPSLVSYTCGQLPESILTGILEGSVIGQVVPMNRMSEEYKLIYKTIAGKQAVEQFEGGAKDTLTTTVVSGLTSTKEETALKNKLEIQNEEPLEIKSK